MERKVVSAIMLTLLLAMSMLTLALNIQSVKADWTWAETIYIRADGSVDPDTAPISTVDNITYTLTDNIVDAAPKSPDIAVIIKRDNIILDGAGYTLQSPQARVSKGISLEGRSNVTIKNINVRNFWYGVSLYESSNNIISGNNITDNDNGVGLISSSNFNTVSGNTMTNNNGGVDLGYSAFNTVSGNVFVGDGLRVRNSWIGNVIVDNTVNGRPLVYLDEVSDYTVGDAGQVILVNCNRITVENLNLSNTAIGVQLRNTDNSAISGNNMTNNSSGVGLSGSSNNTISGNTITNNNQYGVDLSDSSNFNTVSGNNITNNSSGVGLSGSSNNTISGNTITNNEECGIYLHEGIGVYESSDFNSISGNTITNNQYGIDLRYSDNNTIYHNYFIDNSQQVKPYYTSSVWDNGYPSGGNYWSDYDGVDLCSGPYQNETGGDGIGDTPYIVDPNNLDRYPLIPEHELVTSITAPAFLWLGSSVSLKVIVTNEAVNNEVNVEFMLLINETMMNSTTIPLLKSYNSHTLETLWTPSTEGTYNVTAYASPVPKEVSVANNKMTRIVTVAVPPKIGIKTGDWIKWDYTVAGAPSGTPVPTWIKLEFLSVEVINATVRVIMHMSDGTEQNETMTIDIVTGEGTLGTFSGVVIPANCTTGDSIYISGYGNLTLAGETTRSYAGASRTVVYASFSQYGVQLTYYWDKQTGVMVEASTTSYGVTATAKATETNMWQAQPSGLPIDPTVFYALIIVAIVVVAALAFLMIRRRKKPLEEIKLPKS